MLTALRLAPKNRDGSGDVRGHFGKLGALAAQEHYLGAIFSARKRLTTCVRTLLVW